MKISIIFNKVDPELDFKSVLITKCMAIFEKFAEIVDQSKHYLTVFYTSIFDPMSIIVGFSEILLEANLRQAVNAKLEEFKINETPYYETVMIDNFLELAHIERDSTGSPQIPEALKEEFIKIKSNFVRNAWISLKPATDKGIMIDDYYIRAYPIKTSNAEYYYLLGVKNPDEQQKQTINSLLPKIGEDISQLIRGFS